MQSISNNNNNNNVSTTVTLTNAKLPSALLTSMTNTQSGNIGNNNSNSINRHRLFLR